MDDLDEDPKKDDLREINIPEPDEDEILDDDILGIKPKKKIIDDEDDSLEDLIGAELDDEDEPYDDRGHDEW